jgi:hypothetical protein
MTTHYIDGNQSGWMPRNENLPGWSADMLYPEGADIDDENRMIVSGKDAALSLAKDLFESFSAPSLSPDEEYRCRYDVIRADGSVVKRFERIERGAE